MGDRCSVNHRFGLELHGASAIKVMGSTRSVGACIALTRSEIVAAPSNVLMQHFSASDEGQSRKFRTNQAWLPVARIPVGNDAWYCARILLIYQPMNLTERSLLHVVQELHKSASPHGGESQNVRSSADLATLVASDELHVHSRSFTSQVGVAICTLRLNRVLLRSLARYGSFNESRSIRPWRIAD
jgi:hypothetical protein